MVNILFLDDCFCTITVWEPAKEKGLRLPCAQRWPPHLNLGSATITALSFTHHRWGSTDYFPQPSPDLQPRSVPVVIPRLDVLNGQSSAPNQVIRFIYSAKIHCAGSACYSLVTFIKYNHPQSTPFTAAGRVSPVLFLHIKMSEHTLSGMNAKSLKLNDNNANLIICVLGKSTPPLTMPCLLFLWFWKSGGLNGGSNRNILGAVTAP